MSLTGSMVMQRHVESAERAGERMRLLTLLTRIRTSVGCSDAFAATPHDRTLARDAAEGDGGEERTRSEQMESFDGTSAHQPGDSTFDAFFERHEQPLYGYLRRLLPTHEIALEVAQEAFFRSWTHFEQVRAYERPEAWLFRVATNLAISQLRRRHPLSFAQVLHRRGADSEGNDGSEEEVLAGPLDIEGDAALRDLINRVLLHLPERQRAALLLRTVHGFSGEEIAGMLGVSVANARQILSRGRERFRQLYEEATREQGERD